MQRDDIEDECDDEEHQPEREGRAMAGGLLIHPFAQWFGGRSVPTGGIGATGNGEAFGRAYELPNETAYCETCAAIGNVYWNHQMFLLQGEGRYIDVLERTMVNAALSGISLEGDWFFYPNVLESIGQHGRSPWFGCACCPSNVARFIPSVPGFAYAVKDNDVYVNLFLGSEVTLDAAGKQLKLVQETRYPWDGQVKIQVEPERAGRFAVLLRIPGFDFTLN